VYQRFEIGVLRRFLQTSWLGLIRECSYRYQTETRRFNYSALASGDDRDGPTSSRRFVGLRAERSPHPSDGAGCDQFILLSLPAPSTFKRRLLRAPSNGLVASGNLVKLRASSDDLSQRQSRLVLASSDDLSPSCNLPSLSPFRRKEAGQRATNIRIVMLNLPVLSEVELDSVSRTQRITSKPLPATATSSPSVIARSEVRATWQSTSNRD
jgi:hypothetical protein